MKRYLTLFAISMLIVSCADRESYGNEFRLTEEFKDYWYSGKAEITTYDLEQSRYGELRKGTATLIYVTEDFSASEQVKSSDESFNKVSVLKLNSTKNFNTGIYPYSIMQSSFFPLDGNEHALKISTSVQEWCGQVYMQLNNREDFDITSHSYFAGEADQYLKLNPIHLENEIWNLLRIDLDRVPVGSFKILPSFEFLRLNHLPVSALNAEGQFLTSEQHHIYQLYYPQLNRTIKIYLNKIPPFTIEKWEESAPVDNSPNAEILTTTATKKARLRTDYWNKNSNKDLHLREKLELD
ncbi:septum formation inhibitor Maf [uncultured Christiangramia sp.]|uniref:septum formation inhibitor Maf n=1 Tax=uncultured Christiangramia sp. TaxID=503836 RepID=UPI0025FB1D98|nr:septum formation inhibitor Maf [uncultured Christiangramia sp.]